MRYQILVSDTAVDLEEHVRLAITNGWRPQGGVSISIVRYEREVERKGYSESHWDSTYAQAMVADELDGKRDQ